MMKRDRQKEKKQSTFSFGQIMVPLIGLVAIGLLYLGIKMFFFAPVKTLSEQATAPNVIAQPATPKSEEKPQVSTASKAAKPSVPIEDPSLRPENNVIATPSSKASTDSSTASVQESQKIVAKQQPSQSQTSQPSDSQISEGGWGVQVGSFTEKWRAEDVKNKLETSGYQNKVRITEAVVNGKRYYRVQVYAGKDNSDAKELEKNLKAMNLPTLIVKY
jgi:cell division protein FtsN